MKLTSSPSEIITIFTCRGISSVSNDKTSNSTNEKLTKHDCVKKNNIDKQLQPFPLWFFVFKISFMENIKIE